MKPTQKFIAGASCPNCGEEDSLLIDSSDQSIECVDCGYSQTPEERDKKPEMKEKVQVKKISATDIIQIKNLED